MRYNPQTDRNEKASGRTRRTGTRLKVGVVVWGRQGALRLYQHPMVFDMGRAPVYRRMRDQPLCLADRGAGMRLTRSEKLFSI